MSRIASIPDTAPTLPGLDAVCMETGLDQLPAGAAELLAKELRFVVCLMQHGQQKRAAIEAGYKETSADQIASELLRKPRVANFYRRCLESLGATAKAALARTEQRARLYHEKAIEYGQHKDDIDELLATGGKHATYKGSVGSVAQDFITKREHFARLEERYAKLALEQDKVLLTAAGKMGLELKVSGSIDANILVTPAVMASFTRLREEALHGNN